MPLSKATSKNTEKDMLLQIGQDLFKICQSCTVHSQACILGKLHGAGVYWCEACIKQTDV